MTGTQDYLVGDYLETYQTFKPTTPERYNWAYELFEKWGVNSTPLRREQTPEDIGNTVAFLASDEARNITGQAIHVDGGVAMG